MKQHTGFRCLAALCLALACAAAAAPRARVPAAITGNARVYVRADAAPGGDGISWESALGDIRAALDRAEELGGGEVRVARGTYYPSEGSGRDATFRLRPGVALRGGFPGTGDRADDADPNLYPTVLSGDLGVPDDDSDNACHVVTGADNAVLDGFIITGGNAEGPPGGGPGRGGPPRPGGGPQVHTTPEELARNAGNGSGGGLLNLRAAPTVRNCVFRRNRAMKGGAVYNLTSADFPPRPGASEPAALFEACVFEENRARARGGGVANDMGTNPTFRNCVFRGNVCEEKGGGLYNDFGCSPTLVNCLFVRNEAFRAGAVGNDGASSPVLVCCTITENRAEDAGAGLYQGTGPANNPILIRCILRGNRCDNGPADLYNWHDNTPEIRESCIGGGYPGPGNTDGDPRFIDPDRDDFRLGPDSPCPQAGYTADPPDSIPSPPEPERMRPGRKPTAARTGNAAGPPIRVRADAPRTDGDGTSWETACRDLSDALERAATTHAEVWVAAGTYRPRGDGRQATFRLPPGITVLGGFAGNESRRDERDPQQRETILSGDIGNPGDDTDNAYHVVTGADRAVLDGVTIAHGNADGIAYDGKGGGLINYLRAPQGRPGGPSTGYSTFLRDCMFRDNRAREGGAVYSYDRGQPVFERCGFRNNRAEFGGAVLDRVGVESTFKNCLFTGNRARYRGGALYLDYGARPKLSGCIFSENTSDTHGGAVYLTTRASQLESTVALFTACSFGNNSAAKRGGAIANEDKNTLLLARCFFLENVAPEGPALDNRRSVTAVLESCTIPEDGVLTDAGSRVLNGPVAPYLERRTPMRRGPRPPPRRW